MTAETNTPLQFRQIQDIHERFKGVNPAFERMSLPEFSTYMEQQTQQPMFEAGKNDNFLMRASAGIDRALEYTGLPQASGFVGKGVGSAIGMEREMGELFRSFPRMVGTIAPMLLTAPLSLPVAGAGLAASAALGGLDAYEKSGGSPTAGLIGGAAVPATLGVARVAGQQALKKMGAPLIDDLFGRSFLAPATTTQKLSQYGAENLGAMAVGEIAGQAQSLASGQGFYNPLDPKNLALMLAGNIPFAALDAIQLTRPLARPNTIVSSGEGARIQKEVSARLQSGLDAPVRASEDGGFVVRDPAGRIISLTDDVDEATKVQQFADDLPATNPAEPLGLVRQQGYMDGAFVKRFFADEAEPSGVNRESARGFAFQQVQDTLSRGGKVAYQIENGPTMNITGLRGNQMVTDNGQMIVGLGLYSDAENGRLVFERPAENSSAEGINPNLAEANKIEAGQNTQATPQKGTWVVAYHGGRADADLNRPGTYFSLSSDDSAVKAAVKLAEKEGHEAKVHRVLIQVAGDERMWPGYNQHIHFQNTGNTVIRPVGETPKANFSLPTRSTTGEVIPASGDIPLVYRVGELFRQQPNGTTMLGNRYTLDQNQSIGGVQFEKAMEIGGVPKYEVEMYKVLAPEAFGQDGSVNVGRLVTDLKNKPPLFELVNNTVIKDGFVLPAPRGDERLGDSIMLEAARAKHELETAGYFIERDTMDESVTLRDREGNFIDPEVLPPELVPFWDTIGASVEDAVQDPWQALQTYQFVAPKKEKEMPGYVEGLIRVPEEYGDLYAGPHFGSRDKNVLSFFRGYEETLPSGEKAFHVIELQSDWANDVRRGNLDDPSMPRSVSLPSLSYLSEGVAEGVQSQLVPRYEQLALQAAIKHAKDVGATKLIISDANTAMYSEGHFARANLVPKLAASAAPSPFTVTFESSDSPALWSALTNSMKSFRTTILRADQLPEGFILTKKTQWAPQPRYGDLSSATKGSLDSVDVTDPLNVSLLDTKTGQFYKIEGIDPSNPGQRKADNDTMRALGKTGPWNEYEGARLMLAPISGFGPRQEAGMRLHYDATMPNTASKLLGDKGTMIDLGPHKTAGQRVIGRSFDLTRKDPSVYFSLPEDAAKIRQARDAQEALLQYQDTVARATGAAPAIADIKATVSPFLNDWDQRRIGLNNVTPQEAVTRAINVLAGKVDKLAATKKSETTGQDDIDPVLRAAVEQLPLPYQERAAGFIRKYGLSELEGQGLDLDPQMREGLLNRMRSLSEKTTDADVKSAIDQEIEYFQQPRDENYDPDLAMLLEDYQPYLELGGGAAKTTAKKDQDISDATNLVYAEVLRQFQKGVAPQDIKLSPGLIISRIKTQGVATDFVPSLKYNEATGDWEPGRLNNKQEAEAFVLKLATDNPDPAVRYQIIQQRTTEGGREVPYFQVRKKENLLQRVVEGYNPDNTAIFRNLGKEGSPADLGDMDLMEFYDNYGARGDAPMANKGIRGGQQFLADTLHARGMAIADMLPDNAYAPAHREMAKDRLKVLLELERNREVFRVDKKGKLKDIDHKTIQEAWSQAGGLELVSTRESDLPRTIRLKVESLMKTFSQAASQDPIMSRLSRNLSEFAQWAREAGPGESPEFFAARRVIDEAASKLKELHKNVGMVVLPDVRDLRGYNKAIYDEVIKRGGTAEAYFDKNRQEIVVIANNVIQKSGEITLADSMARVLWHEGAGHFGMEKMLGNEYNAIMRSVLRKIDDGARKSIMDTYDLKDRDDLLIAEEYLASKAETDPELSLLGETVGALRSYARAFGKFPFGRDPQKLGETGYKLTDNDILYTVKRSRDFTLGKRGLIPGGTVADTQTNTMGDEPAGLGVLGKSDYFSLPAQKLTTTKLPDAYNFVTGRGLERGLSPEESNRHAENVVSMLTQRPDPTTMVAQGNGLTMSSPLGGRAFFKRSKQFQDSMIRAQENAFLHGSFARAIDSAPETSPVRKAANDYDAWFASLKIEDIETLRAGLSSIDPDLLLPDGGINARALAGFIADAYVSKDVYALRELLQAAPAPVANLTKALFKDATAMAESSLSLAQAEALGVTEKRGVGMVQRKALERIYDSFIELRKDDASMLKAEQQFLKMENFQPERILEALSGGNDMAGPLKTIADGAMFSIPTNVYRPVPDKAPTAPGWISRMANLPSNIAEDHPAFLPFLRTATAYTALSQQAAAEALKPFGMEVQAGKRVVTGGYEIFKKTARSPHMRRAISDLMLRQNEKVEKLTADDIEAESAGQPPSMTPGSGRLTADEIRNLRQEVPSLRTLSDNDLQSVVAVFEKMTDAASKMSEVIIRSQASNIANTLRNELATQKGWAGLDEIERATNLAVKYLLDPNTANEWQRNRWTTLSSSDFSGMLAKVDGIYRVPFESFAGYLRKRDGYLPEFRLGQYTVAYKDAATGERKTIGAMDLKDVYAKRKELYEKGAAAPGSVEYLSKKASRLESSLLSKGALERAREIEKLTFDQLRTVVGDEVFENQIRPNYEPVTASIHAETQKTMQDYLRRRTLAGGREDLDAIDVLMSYIPAVAYGTARSNVRQTSAFYLKDARIADNEVLREMATTHINNALRASTGSEKVIREAAFQYFMALNPSTMALEMFQSTSSLAPFLTRHGAGFFGSYSELKKSMGQTFQASRNGKFADPELEAMVARAADEAIIGRGLYQELDDPSGALTEVQDTVLGVEHVGRRFGKAYINATRNLYGMTAHFNSRVAFVAGFNRGKKLGMKGEDLYEFARRTTQATMFTGGKGNRAIGLYAGDPSSQPIRAMVGALQSYFQGMVGTMYRYGRESVAKDLPPAQRAAARKAFMQIMGTQLFYAGAMGLPGAAAAVALMEQMFPELELKKNIEEIPKQVLGDTQFGGWMVDSMLYGIPTSSSPIDASARMGLGQVLGVSSLTGFDTTALFGPFGSIVSNVAAGAGELQEGNLTTAAEKISPVFMKNIIKSLKNGGAVRDYSGNLVTQMTGSQRVLTSLGFRPKEIADLQQASSSQKRIARIETRRQSQFLRDQAEALINGDVDTVKQMMMERMQEDPTFDARDNARKISAKAVDMSFPKEIGRGVNVRAADRIAATTGGRQGPRSSELDRLFARSNFERALGVPGTGAPTSNRIQKAMELDFLLEQNPTLTVDQAKLILRQREAAQQFDGSSLLF